MCWDTNATLSTFCLSGVRCYCTCSFRERGPGIALQTLMLSFLAIVYHPCGCKQASPLSDSPPNTSLGAQHHHSTALLQGFIHHHPVSPFFSSSIALRLFLYATVPFAETYFSAFNVVRNSLWISMYERFSSYLFNYVVKFFKEGMPMSAMFTHICRISYGDLQQ